MTVPSPRSAPESEEQSNLGAELTLAITALGAASVVGWLARRLDGRGAAGIDREVRRAAQRKQPASLHRAGKTISLVGYPAVYIPAAWFITQHLRRERIVGADAVLGASLGVWPLYRLLKFAVDRRRPPSQDGDSGEERSFPSGHTAGVTAVAGTTAYALARQKQLSWPMALLLGAVPLLVGAARVYADEHWTSDVVGGLLTGLAVAAVASEWLERTSPRPEGNLPSAR